MGACIDIVLCQISADEARFFCFCPMRDIVQLFDRYANKSNEQ